MSLNRFKKGSPCPVCGGYDQQGRGKGKRCFGFLSEDGKYAHCTREEYAYGLPFKAGSNSYAHLLDGECHCGTTHNYSGSASRSSGGSVILTAYDYRDENGELLYQVCRMNPKGFFQRRPDGKGGWIKNLQGVRRVLYRLPELLSADERETVYICEGEKDCDALRKLGLIATTNSGGAEKWNDEYSEALRGRGVVILPDNDEAGQKHAAQVAKSLNGIAASIKVVKLPELSEHGDVSDWLAAGGTVEKLQEIAASQEPFVIPSDSGIESLEDVADDEDFDVCMADVEPEEVEWLIEPYIPLGKLIIVEGDPDEGKSFAMLGIAAAITNGGELPFGRVSEAGNVVLCSAEDGRADTIRPRLDLLGADVRRVFAVTVPLVLDDRGFDRLERLIVKRSAKMVLFDPLFAFVGGKVDINQDNKVRGITSRLADIAERTRCAIVALRHLPKAQQRNAKAAGSNSIAWTAAARSVLLFGHEPTDEQARGFVHTKHNLSKAGASQGYRIDDVGGKPHFHWTGESQLTAAKILGAVNYESAGKLEIEKAEEFLLESLRNGELPQKEVERLAKRARISEATLRRAKEKLGVVSFRQKEGVGAWFWRLPSEDSKADSQREPSTDEHVAERQLTLLHGAIMPLAQVVGGEHLVAGMITPREHVLEKVLTSVNKEDTAVKADAQNVETGGGELVDMPSVRTMSGCFQFNELAANSFSM